MVHALRPSFFLVLVLASILSGCAHTPETPALGACPLAGTDEKAEDCPWAAIGRIGQEKEQTIENVGGALQAYAPTLWAELLSDAYRTNAKPLWGRSLNTDESANGTIVEPLILDALLQTAKVSPRDGQKAHAGITHTYGYLFSTLKTPYGYKRARWVRSDIEKGFGIRPGLLSPIPPQGTLFLNLTYFAGRIAFRDDALALARVETEKTNVSTELQKFDFSTLKPKRLLETVSLPSSSRKKVRTLYLRTDIVPFPKGETNGLSALLIYSIRDSSKMFSQLITVFPVSTSFAESIFDPKGLGPQKVSTRYNAFVEGLTNAPQPLTGVRTVWQEPARR